MTKLRWRPLARIAIALAILVALLTQTSLAEIAATIGRARAGPLVWAWLLSLLGQLLAAERLRRLARAQQIALPLASVFQINLATMFYGLFVPGGNVAGLAFRIWRVGADQKRYGGATQILIYDRLIATGSLCAVGVGFWLVARPATGGAALGAMLAVLVVLLLIQDLLRRSPPAGLRRLGRRLAQRWPALLRSLRQELAGTPPMPWSTVLGAWMLGAATHLVGTAAYALVAVSLALDLPAITVGWTRAAAMLAATLPVSIAGLGVREAAFVALLVPLGPTTGQVIGYSLLAFVLTIVSFAVLGGLLEAGRLLWPVLPRALTGDARPPRRDVSADR